MRFAVFPSSPTAAPRATLDFEDRVARAVVTAGRQLILPAEAELEVEGVSGFRVDVGNPHFVIFEPGPVSMERAAKLGAELAGNPVFPEGANIEFVDASHGDRFEVIVYERGCGLTQACGTGATAVVAAAVRCGRAQADVPKRVELPGGSLRIEVKADLSQTWMTGPALEVFRGRLR